MKLIDEMIFKVRCSRHERSRSMLAQDGPGDRELRDIQRIAWPDAGRLDSEWSSERFVVFDTETTGLDHINDRAVSLGAVAVERGRIKLGDTFHMIMDSGRRPSRESVVVHGLMPDKLADAGKPEDVIRDFLIWAGDAVLVAHHAAFDLAMLNPSVINILGVPIQNLVLDTAVLARRFGDDNSVGYDLDSLLETYDIPQSGVRHDALGDTLMTARLLQKLLKKFGTRGVTSLRRLAVPYPVNHASF